MANVSEVALILQTSNTCLSISSSIVPGLSPDITRAKNLKRLNLGERNNIYWPLKLAIIDPILVVKDKFNYFFFIFSNSVSIF